MKKEMGRLSNPAFPGTVLILIFLIFFYLNFFCRGEILSVGLLPFITAFTRHFICNVSFILGMTFPRAFIACDKTKDATTSCVSAMATRANQTAVMPTTSLSFKKEHVFAACYYGPRLPLLITPASYCGVNVR